jgi:hypothetical protein
MKTLGTLVVIAGLLVAFAGCATEKQSAGGMPAANVSEARAAAEGVAAAVNAYRDCRGELPASLYSLTRETTVAGVTCGPTLDSVPNPPPGWMSYLYTVRANGTFSIVLYNNKGSQTISVPSQ